ncbi:acetoacetyl-CoA synthase [Desulfarculus baarsii DSM 2075]|uniref:Acetoacetyl-CoA synthase n=1 Tax=Desulfarculus baarsii (strain ATCC 33931 / DSM 2075 / LMG 7858 / VKM B-1802 / 2st14) TaxID=644282 RepID=E1QE52_DESB2|nr:acetoacetate--CoA ligase [Desulfarculus baarsii]ADK83838.1 acetoacetyl-CoA synthase [Desulfarculus baarsii DSM 2075]
MPTPLWTPSPERVARANLSRFIAFVNQRHGLDLAGYAALHAWSIDQRADFWRAVWDFCEVRASRPAEAVTQNPEAMPGARWFVGARLNFAENLLRQPDDRPALIFCNEIGHQRRLSRAQLLAASGRLSRALAAVGVGPGDRVAGFMPNIPETVIGMLATASLGAIWSSCSPDFGFQGVMDRFGQIRPKVMLCADGYPYGGKRFDCLERAALVGARIDSLERIVVAPYMTDAPDLSAAPKAIAYDDFVAGHGDGPPAFAQLPFDHPLYIMYSSGTTGAPKCIVHGAGGTLLQHLKEHALQCDLTADDTLFYFTTCGWMMWNWLVSALAVGAAVALYDGSPFHPGPEVLWRMSQEEGVSVFGTSARYLAALEKSGLRPAEAFDLGRLKAVLSTGSPLAPEQFDWAYQNIKADMCLSSISGGTDIISCFAGGNPIGPVYPGQLQAPGLGMAVQAWDENGRALWGQKGELVCVKPFPSMPVGFWNDPDDEKYQSAYFRRFAGVWHHGDYCEMTPEGGVIIHGRSDATLNPGGVRIGTAEIYRQVEGLAQVADSLVVGQRWRGDERVILFVKMAPGHQLDQATAQAIATRIRQNTTPRHVPAKILAVDDIPYTISGKKVEMAVRNVIEGRPVTNKDALANPQALALFADRPELAE